MSTSFEARIVLRPRSLDETFDLAIRYFRATMRDFMKMYAIFTIVITGGIVGAAIFFDLSFEVQGALAVAIVPFYERVVTVFAGRHLFANPTSVSAAFGAVLKRFAFLSMHAAIILAPVLMILLSDDEGTMAAFGVMLGLAWGLFVVPSHMHVTEVVLLEQLPAGRAMKRARILLHNSFGRALGSFVFTGVVRGCVVAMVYFGLNFVVGFVLQFESASEHLGPYFAVFGYVLAAPYVALARLFDYVDARTRREGWDIQVRFNAIAQKYAREEAKRLAA